MAAAISVAPFRRIILSIGRWRTNMPQHPACGLLAALSLTACQGPADAPAALDANAAAAAVAKVQLPPPPPPQLGADGTVDVAARIAENNRMIEQNKKDSAATAALQAEDPGKYDILTKACQGRFGEAVDADSARRIIHCIDKAW